MKTIRASAARSGIVLALVLAADGAFTAPRASESTEAREVIEAMRARYPGGRYESLTFVQRTIRYPEPGRADTTLWYEAIRTGRLRIDTDREAGNGAIYRDEVRYGFKDGALVDVRPEINPMALALDYVYSKPVERSLFLLDSLGFDLDQVHEVEWDGRPAWLIGAAPGDDEAAQLWIEKERLLPVRVSARHPAGALIDARIGGYRRIGGTWVETEIVIYVNGNLYQTEEYTNVRVNVPVGEHLFDPENWRVEDRYWEPVEGETNVPADAAALFREIHDRYVGKRFSHVTFVQRTESADGSVELWYEAIRPPGLVRVDKAPLGAGRGFMYRADSLYTFEGGRVATGKGDERWITMLALVDVYAQPVAATLARLADLGVDLSTVHEASWEGRPAIVVGAAAGDTAAAQIWYDREHLYPVRVVQPAGDGHPRVEFHISGHRFVAGGWIERRIDILVNGGVVTTECYGEIRPHPGLEDTLFDPAAFGSRRWAERTYPEVSEAPVCD